jgi:hypothetical protein
VAVSFSQPWTNKQQTLLHCYHCYWHHWHRSRLHHCYHEHLDSICTTAAGITWYRRYHSLVLYHRLSPRKIEGKTIWEEMLPRILTNARQWAGGASVAVLMIVSSVTQMGWWLCSCVCVCFAKRNIGMGGRGQPQVQQLKITLKISNKNSESPKFHRNSSQFAPKMSHNSIHTAKRSSKCDVLNCWWFDVFYVCCW